MNIFFYNGLGKCLGDMQLTKKEITETQLIVTTPEVSSDLICALGKISYSCSCLRGR